MKTTKRFIAMAAALALTTCAAMPMAMMTANADSITITGLDTSKPHSFEVYQILTGDLSEGILSNLKWGTNVSAYDGTSVTAGNAVPKTTSDAMSNMSAREIAAKVTLTGAAVTSGTSNSTEITLNGLDPGYYLVKDVTSQNGSKENDANSAWIVQVAGSASIAIKNAYPTVDKQVADDETPGFYEAADHAIGETFEFKITGSVPSSDNMDAYTGYKMVFHDTLSAGVDYVGHTAVKVTFGNGTERTIELPEGSITTTKDDTSGVTTLTITIADLMTYMNPSGVTGETLKGSNVVVTYDAKLNSNALAYNDNVTNEVTNNNKVFLEYSNAPDSNGDGTTDTSKTGKTPEDTVWVFTYKVDNNKTKENGDMLQGAQFTLYESDGTTPIALAYDSTGKFYYPDASGTATLTSTSDGETPEKAIFNIKGLDAGTYVLKETSTPAGYNTCAPITIEIEATHDENSSTSGADLELTKAVNVNNTIVDTQNSTLPSTGGIGTTLFILGGGCAAGIAGIYLISKKKTREEE